MVFNFIQLIVFEYGPFGRLGLKIQGVMFQKKIWCFPGNFFNTVNLNS